MKYLKTFENFDLGRFSDQDADEQEWLNKVHDKNETEQECEPCGSEGEEEGEEHWREEEGENWEEEGPEEMELTHRPRVWGDEVVERKKAKPDFLDLDKDGNKKESMKKAAKDAKEKKDDKKEDKKDEKDSKELSAAQKKLPAALQKAILARKKK